MTATKGAMTTPQNHVKIFFEVADEDDPGEVEIESIWTIPAPDGYRIDNIPFHAYGVALDDIVAAAPDEDGRLFFERTHRASGNSCLRLIVESADSVLEIREALRARGCESELSGRRLVAVNVPPAVTLETIIEYLEGLEQSGVASYEEASIVHR